MDTDLAWTKWGATDPYFGVLSDPRYRRNTIKENLASFFSSGHAHVDELLMKIERSFGPIGRQSVIDFGCGVGRLSLPLAGHFQNVVGADVSEPMLAEARCNADRASLNNVTFVRSDDGLSTMEGGCDLVNSYIVFQHIPAVRGMKIMAELVARVAPGGVASIHVCVSHLGGTLAKLVDVAHRIPMAHRLLNTWRGQPVGEPIMEMNAYDFGAIAHLLDKAGFGSLVVEPQVHGRFMTVNILARRHRPS